MAKLDIVYVKKKKKNACDIFCFNKLQPQLRNFTCTYNYNKNKINEVKIYVKNNSERTYIL